MGESWSFTQQGAGGGGGEISPGVGSTGFSSRALVFGNSSGQLVNAGAPQWDSTQSFLGVGTTAPAGPLDVFSTLGMFLSTAAAGGLQFRGGGPSITAPTTAQLNFRAQSLGNPKMVLSAVGLSVQSTVNGNIFTVIGTTAQAGAIISCETTGDTAKLGFFSTVGSTQASSYTTSPGAGKVMPATNIAAGAAEINQLIGVVNAIIGDFKAYGLFKT